MLEELEPDPPDVPPEAPPEPPTTTVGEPIVMKVNWLLVRDIVLVLKTILLMFREGLWHILQIEFVLLLPLPPPLVLVLPELVLV